MNDDFDPTPVAGKFYTNVDGLSVKILKVNEEDVYCLLEDGSKENFDIQEWNEAFFEEADGFEEPEADDEEGDED